jgi:dihydrofolate synthase/folylpolyglutamate synthase
MSQATAVEHSYEKAIAHLNALIPELFSAPGTPRRKFSLQEIGILCSALGDPQKRFPSVLIAGTNGKGSTASTLASIARESGLRVGLYTSPHLDRVNERIRLLEPKESSGAPALDSETWELATGRPLFPENTTGEIPDQIFGRLYFKVHDIALQLVRDQKLPAHPSFFELLTALSFLYFAESKVDLAVLEVGMGGRLDATNLVDPILSVVTDISLDHQEWLGSTIDLITREKAGILRPNGILVTLPQHPEANQALGEVATALDVRGVNATEYMPQINADPNQPYAIETMGRQILVDSPLKGAHQHRNLALAIASAVELAQNSHLPHPFPITPEAIERGIKNTRWPGRLERINLPDHPEFILDVAHNPAGAWALRAALGAKTKSGAPGLASETWDSASNEKSVLIFACLRDKPLREMTQILFPIFDHVILAPIHSPRATELADLHTAAEATGVPSTPAGTVAEALHLALNLHPSRIVISGSVYLVGEARHILLAKQQAPHRPEPAPEGSAR